MSKNLEIESKALINEESYKKLTVNNENLIYTQVNYYIDTSKHTLPKNLGLRIRYKSNRYELTLKEDQQFGRMEYNQIIDENDFINFKDNYIFPSGEVKNKLLSLNININLLTIFGTITTHRLDIKYKNSLLSVDKNEYLDKIDYEVECESKSPQESSIDLKSFLNEKSVEYNLNTSTKLSRLLNSLN